MHYSVTSAEGRRETSPPLEVKRSWLLLNYAVGILEPSVAQPPLPLQEFLPLQPLSLLLHPPLPLQEF
jgi:hypothetical protein